MPVDYMGCPVSLALSWFIPEWSIGLAEVLAEDGFWANVAQAASDTASAIVPKDKDRNFVDFRMIVLIRLSV